MRTIWRTAGIWLLAVGSSLADPSIPQSSLPNPQSSILNPQSLEVFRIFLTDGRILNSYGECATLPEELVCVVKPTPDLSDSLQTALLAAEVSERQCRAVRAERTGRASALDSAVRRFAALDATLASMQPLPEVREVHALLRSAVQMARQGLVLGQRVAVARNAEASRNASSAVAGAELLLEQGRSELIRALYPRKVR